MTDNTDSETTHRLRPSRRQFVTVLAATGTLGAVATAQNGGENTLTAGGGDMSDELSHLRINIYGGDVDQRPDPGIVGRYFRVDDPDDERYGTVYEDLGDEWDELDIGIGALEANEILLKDTAAEE